MREADASRLASQLISQDLAPSVYTVGTQTKHSSQNPQLALQIPHGVTKAQPSQTERTKSWGQASLVQLTQSVRAGKLEGIAVLSRKLPTRLPWQVSCRAGRIISVGYPRFTCCVAAVRYRTHPKCAMRAAKAQVIQSTFLPSDVVESFHS